MVYAKIDSLYNVTVTFMDAILQVAMVKCKQKTLQRNFAIS